MKYKCRTKSDVPCSKLACFQQLDEIQQQTLQKMNIPMPSRRTRITDSTIQSHVDTVARQMGISVSDLVIPPTRFGERDVFFTNIERKAVVVPEKLECTTEQDDIIF